MLNTGRQSCNDEIINKRVRQLAICAAFALMFCSFCPIGAFAETIRIEAENAALSLSSGGTSPAQIVNDPSCSGGKYVDTRDGNLTFSFTVAEAGYYAVTAKTKSPYGDKINTFQFDNDNTKDVSFPQNNTFTEVPIVDSYYFSSGAHQIKMIRNWGWIQFDYLEISPANAKPIEFDIQPLVTPQPSESAAKLYQFLLDNFQHKIISGVMTLKSLATVAGSEQNEISWLFEKTGKKPALLGLDFMDYAGAIQPDWINNPDNMKDAIAWKNNNGIVAFCWHWRDPSHKTPAFYTSDTDFDPRQIFDPNSDGYKAMMRDMDIIAGYLKELQAAGVPVLWRPLHEASGGWFWWGSQGPSAFKKIWQVMFDKFTNDYQLNNLIWVYTSDISDNALDWYPGDAYVDIIGMDIYDQGNHGSQMLSFEELNKMYNGKKLLTLAECGSIPSMAAMKRDNAIWSYYMPWYGDFTKNSDWNAVNDWANSLSDPDVISLDDMPATIYSSLASPDSNKFFVGSAHGKVNIQTTSPWEYQVYLYGLAGRLCLTKKGLSGNQIFSIPCLNQACYLLAIENKEQRTCYKIQINP